MKRLFTPNKFFVAVIFFCLGFLANHLLVKFKPQYEVSTYKSTRSSDDQFPVDPKDFDQQGMLDTIRKMHAEEMGDMSGIGGLGEVNQREDAHFVYYDIPSKGQDGTNHKLNVEIKDGMIKISEDVKSTGNTQMETSSERMFSIDPGLDADKAEVMNEKDKITIRIPKK